MASFQDLGIRQELLRTLEDEDIASPTAVQEAAVPVLRRGGNLVARAGAGSGKTLAYTLGILDRLEPRETEGEEDEPELATRFVVLVPTREAAERTALSIYPYAQAAGMAISVPGGSWGTPAGTAEIVVASATDAMEAVRGSTLKLDSVEALVVDGAADVEQLGGWEAVETLFDHLPREAQRVLLTTAYTQQVEDLVDRRVKRALRFPAEAAMPGAEQAEIVGQIGYILVTEREKLEILSRSLSGTDRGDNPPPLLFCRTDERAATLAEALTMRGFLVGEAEDEETDVVIAASGVSRAELIEESGEEPGQTISFDVPADVETLRARHGGDADAVILLEPRELPHLRDVAKRAQLRVRPVTLPLQGPAAGELERFREELRRALREEDVGAQLLVLEPLLEEFGAVEVAAAAAALLRRRRPAQPTAAAGAGAGAQQAQPAAAPARTATNAQPAGAAPATWARLFVGVGNKDGVRPGDLVGAIAGEANIAGSKVGKIDIRDSFSIVEVHADVADQVIRSVNGTTVKGRSVRVDYDRGEDRSARRRAPAGGRAGGPGAGGRAGGPRAGGPGGGGGRTPIRRPRPPQE